MKLVECKQYHTDLVCFCLPTLYPPLTIISPSQLRKDLGEWDGEELARGVLRAVLLLNSKPKLVPSVQWLGIWARPLSPHLKEMLKRGKDTFWQPLPPPALSPPHQVASRHIVQRMDLQLWLHLARHLLQYSFSLVSGHKMCRNTGASKSLKN